MRVLIVEDCPDDAELLCAELAQCGEEIIFRRVECAEDMRAALAEDWDIVISDHTMPQFSSVEALETLKASGKDIPFIIYSGEISEQTAVSAMRAGVHDFVRKGQAARLVPLVQRELRNAETRNARKIAESRLYRLAHYDPLTGLPNRDFFCEEAGRIVAAASHDSATFAVCLLSLDRFGEVNHAVGFVQGDRIIKQVAERLKARLMPAGLLARLNGDHFALFSSRLHDASAVRHFADTMLGCFKAPFDGAGTEVYLTCSLGIALFPDHGDDVGKLLVNAEAAAAAAKHVSGNSYRCYEEQLAQTTARRVGLEAALRHAVERDELVLHYQPMVALATERVIGAEALVRWRHPQLGVLLPDTFIPIADETGLIVEIGAAVMMQACRQVKDWHDHGLTDMRMSINVSPAQFDEKTLLKHVDEALRATNVDPRALEIEITESVLMRDVAGTTAMLRALKDRGIAISIDDFGTGYSSLSYLKRFPIDTLKIDRSFIRDVVGNPDGLAIVCAIVALARRLQLCV
ncbi:MAG TPA: EAL domain-containing protein, partial [Burkholderiales bacterium]|nr:EAL domain-containing protein [Burkholderiales bacterium]